MQPKTASAAPQTEGAQRAPAAAPNGCKNIATLEITGYRENQTRLPRPAAKQLAAVAKALRGSHCRVRIIGYASDPGPNGLRDILFRVPAAAVAPAKVRPAIQKMSMARASAVARELKRLGVGPGQIKTAASIGGGRRVLVTAQ
jgi:outer membrane protein OmpA-like peptidoglycan-associated protein